MSGSDLADESIPAGPFTLRPWEAADLPWMQHACQDPEIHRWTHVPRPYGAADALAFLAYARHARAAGTAYPFAIVDTDSGALLGSIDVRDLDGERPGRIGYWVAWDARGGGVASTALTALVGWCTGRLGLGEVWLVAAETNQASRRVAERAGFRVERVEDGLAVDGDEAVPGVVYARP